MLIKKVLNSVSYRIHVLVSLTVILFSQSKLQKIREVFNNFIPVKLVILEKPVEREPRLS